MSRPTKYKQEYNEQAFKLCLLGATDKSLADFFGVEEKTVNNWKEEHPEFLQSLKAGKEEADAKVAQKLYHRALGYSHPEDKFFIHEGKSVIVPFTKYYPPDATSAIFWLKNRKSEVWKDRREVDANVNHTFEQLLDDIEED
jgi:hypothetical protein